MRAVTVHGAGDLRLEDVPTPVPGPGQVVVSVAFGGICGSDLHYAEHGRNGIYELRETLVLGHEIAGVVAGLGAGVVGHEVGERVVVHPATPTPPPGGEQGRGLHLAVGGTYLGSASTTPHTQGGFCDLLVVEVDQLRIVPDGLPLRRAALAEPLAVALHGVAQAGDLTGARVLVAGVGPIGALVIAVLARGGVSDIVATDLAPRALALASELGARQTVQIGVDPALEPESFDVAIECSGSPRSLASVLDLVRRGGTLVQLGLLPTGPLGVPLAALVSRELTLRGSQRFDVELDEAVRMLSEAPQVDAVVSHVFAASEAAAAFATAADSTVSTKVLLEFAGSRGDDGRTAM